MSLDKKCWAVTTMISRMLSVTYLTSFYPYSLEYPFDIIYLPNPCEASSDLFLLLSNDQLTSEVDFLKS